MGALTQDEKDAIRDKAVAQWWKDWFAADYSWDGLTKFPWQGWKVVESKAVYKDYLKTHGLPAGCPNEACQVVPADFDDLPVGTKTRDATLQDYWRDQEDKLEGQEGGKQYTIAHLPIRYKNRFHSWKNDTSHQKWDDLNRIVRKRINCGIQTKVEVDFLGSEVVTGQDGRSNFQGCILAALPYKSELSAPQHEAVVALHINLQQANLLYHQDFKNTIFGSTTNFSYVQFSGEYADFSGAKFSNGDANFWNTLFSGRGTGFEDAEFSGGNAYFINAQFADGNVTFENAEFSGGQANFNNAQFSGGNASFHKTQFSGGEVYFSYAQFSGGHASFMGTLFSKGEADFICAQFSGGNATFFGSRFVGGDANFSRVQFSGGDAKFMSTQFSGGNADFSDAQFSGGDADFPKAQFSGGHAVFRNAQFSGGDSTFWSAEFKHGFSFANAKFEKRTNFKNSVFPPAAGSENAFRGTEFLGSADFSRNKFKDDDDKPLPPDDLHFPFNAFANVNFKDRILLTQRGEKYAQGEFDRAVRSVKEACVGEDEDRREDRWVALESGCTTLKQAMESISDKNRAQRYFKFELLARQQRPKTGWITKGMTTLYGWAADYGGSIGRPLLALFITWAVFTFGYLWNAWAVEVETAKPWQMLWGAMDFSATHIFRPLFIWSKNIPEDSWLSAYQSQLSTGGWLTVKLLATLQSFLSITLLFLFGLATKRKFQMG